MLSYAKLAIWLQVLEVPMCCFLEEHMTMHHSRQDDSGATGIEGCLNVHVHVHNPITCHKCLSKQVKKYGQVFFPSKTRRKLFSPAENRLNCGACVRLHSSQLHWVLLVQ